MPNLRVVWDNAADRGMIIASSEAGGSASGGSGSVGGTGASGGQLPAINLRSNLKSKVWRGKTIRESIVCQWDTFEPVGCVILAFNNFSSTALIRARGYTQPDNVYPEFDTGFVQGAGPAGLGQFQWGTPLGENFYQRGGAPLFAYGFGGYAVLWIPEGRGVRKLEIAINDPDNPDAYVEVGRLIVGPYWSPRHNFDFNHSVEFVDTSRGSRTEAGDLRHERAAKYRRIEFGLSNMVAEDRAAMMRIVRLRGISEPIFLSLFPESDDRLLEQSYQLWGKFADGSGRISNPRYDLYAASLVAEEM